MSINKRILELVEIKAGGNKTRFAALIGWKPQYMSRVTKEGGPSGIAIVERIMEAFPDVNPKWLIMGKGPMLVADPELGGLIDQLIADLRTLQSEIGTMSGARIDELKRQIRDIKL